VKTVKSRLKEQKDVRNKKIFVAHIAGSYHQIKP